MPAIYGNIKKKTSLIVWLGTTLDVDELCFQMHISYVNELKQTLVSLIRARKRLATSFS